MIQDANIVEEFDFNGKSALNDSFLDFIASTVDKVTQGKRAVPLTEALIIAGVVKDPVALRAVTQANKDGLNQYFDLIDVQRFVTQYAPHIQKTLVARIKDKAAPVALGLGTGIALSYVFSKFQKA